MTLKTGDPVPTITATNQDNEVIEIEFDEPTVIYFYPRDGTPGCTTEATQFTKELDSFRDAGVAVFGVSTDSVESHHRFTERENIEIPLLADPNGDIIDRFGVPRKDSGSAERTTYVVADGIVHRIYSNVKADGHARTVLMDLLEDGVVSLAE